MSYFSLSNFCSVAGRITANTTIAEYFETKLSEPENVPSGIKEIQNIEKAMEFIEEHVKNYPINRAFVSEMHKMIVDGLVPPPNGEGDHTLVIIEKLIYK